MSRGLLREVVDRLIKFYGYDVNPEDFIIVKALRESFHPIGALVSIVLSQNTSDKNALKALENLRRRFGPRLEPGKLRSASINELAKLIKPSGMQWIKAKTIVNILNALGNGDALLKEDPEKLRELLLSIPGIGYKTADVFLLMVRGYPTFPIDTHIRRVLYRLGIIGKGEDYESIKRKVMEQIPPNLYVNAHLVLIRHGREMCKSRKPQCSKCPVRDICPKVGVLKDDEG